MDLPVFERTSPFLTLLPFVACDRVWDVLPVIFPFVRFVRVPSFLAILLLLLETSPFLTFELFLLPTLRLLRAKSSLLVLFSRTATRLSFL